MLVHVGLLLVDQRGVFRELQGAHGFGAMLAMLDLKVCLILSYHIASQLS
jgi:hypothetical protein